MQGVFGADAAEVYEETGGRNHAKNARVHVATYQTLGIDRDDGNSSFLLRHYPEDYFSHVVIDECHRSAWGKWSVVLRRNSKAAQIGQTATPRQLKSGEATDEDRADARISADNLAYFGEPVYEYGLAQGMEDGYLAACEIQLAQVNLDATGLALPEIIARNPRDANTGRRRTSRANGHYPGGVVFQSPGSRFAHPGKSNRVGGFYPEATVMGNRGFAVRGRRKTPGSQHSRFGVGIRCAVVVPGVRWRDPGL